MGELYNVWRKRQERQVERQRQNRRKGKGSGVITRAGEGEIRYSEGEEWKRKQGGQKEPSERRRSLIE